MMSRRRSLAVLALIALAPSVSRLGAQTSVTSSSGAPTVTAPTEAQYDAGGATGTSTTWSVTARCDNGGLAFPGAGKAAANGVHVGWGVTAGPPPPRDR